MNSGTVRYSNVLYNDSCCTKKRRFMRKDGNCSTDFHHVPGEWLPYMADIFITLVEIRWRMMLLAFALSYILSWLFFGILFWIIALAHGDMMESTDELCMYEVRSFTAAFLFSLETQTTIGYGARGMSENCMVAIVIVTIQDIISVLIDTVVIGIIVTKMASARKRAQTIGFSNSAVINVRNGHLCLSWRVGDFRRHHMVEGTTHAQLVRHIIHSTGKADVTYYDLEIQNSHIILTTPVTVIHQITPSSPLYKTCLQDLRKESFDLLVSFTYTDDCSGILHQSRTSYTPNEILWGQRFRDMLQISLKSYSVNYALFHLMVKAPMLEISAEEYDQDKHSQTYEQGTQMTRPDTVTTNSGEVLDQKFTMHRNIIHEEQL